MLPCHSKGRDRRKELRGTLGKDPCLALPGKAVGLELVRTDDVSKFGVRHSLQLSHSWSQCDEDRRTQKAQNTKQFGRWWASGLLVDICKWLWSNHMTSGQTWLSLGELVSSSIWKATGIRIRNAESRDVSNAVCAHICICSHTGRSMSAWWRRIYVYSLRRCFGLWQFRTRNILKWLKISLSPWKTNLSRKSLCHKISDPKNKSRGK